MLHMQRQIQIILWFYYLNMLQHIIIIKWSSRAWKTVQENGVKSFGHICLRSLLPLERCAEVSRRLPFRNMQFWSFSSTVFEKNPITWVLAWRVGTRGSRICRCWRPWVFPSRPPLWLWGWPRLPWRWRCCTTGLVNNSIIFCWLFTIQDWC